MSIAILVFLLLITCLAINGAQLCKNGGKKRAPFSCREYDECINGELVRKKCKLSEYFNGRQCDYLWFVKCVENNNCKNGQKYPRGDCNRDYDYCIFGEVVKRSCANNTVFDGQNCVTLEICKKAIEERNSTDEEVAINECIEGKTTNHPSDCTMYKLCENGQWVDKSCKTFQHYDSDTNECTYWSYNCRYGGPCKDNETENAFGRCSEYMECVKGNWQKMYCVNGTYYQEGSCKNSPCPLRPVLNKCSYFTEPGSLKENKCPSDQLFDSIERQCVSREDARCFEGECVDGDTTSVADDCTKYKLCENAKWVEKSCIWLAHYDVVTKQCKYVGYTCGYRQPTTTLTPPTTIVKKETCYEENEKRSVKGDCKRFQVCKNGEWTDDKCNVWGKFDVDEKQCVYFKTWAVHCA